MAISSHGTTFTFSTGLGNLSAKVLSISVEEAQPEIVDMTGVGDALGTRRLIATGDITSPAKVQIDYMRESADLLLLPPGAVADQFVSTFGPHGTLAIGHGSFSVSRDAVIENATTEMAVGNVIRGKITFVINNSL